MKIWILSGLLGLVACGDDLIAQPPIVDRFSAPESVSCPDAGALDAGQSTSYR